MSRRAEQKAAAREARLAAERDAAASEKRRKRLTRLGIALAAIAAAAVLVIVIAGGDDGGDAGNVEGVADSTAMLEGVPQRGSTLGESDAPVVMTEFADLQCPFCKDYALQVLPQIIQEYVRTGQMQLDLRLLRFIGPDSDRGARAAMAARDENKMWNFVDLFYRNQGAEGSGYADDAFIRNIAQAAGIDPQAAVDATGDESVTGPIAEAEEQAQANGINSTPSFLVARRGEEPEKVEVQDLTFEAFQQALAPYLEEQENS